MLTAELLNNYISENYLDVTDQFDDEEHHTGFCSNCNKLVGFQIIERNVSTYRTNYGGYAEDYSVPYSIIFRCPVCKLFKLWIVFKRTLTEEKTIDGKTNKYSVDHLYRVTSLPNEGILDIPELPKEPQSLRKAYKEAIRCMDANCFCASAAMFRRALQIITRDILGAKPSTLDKEIKSLIGVKNNLGITLTNDFSDNGYIIKECGNQGAHPDKNPELLEFTQEDAQNLYNIFIEIVSDLFVTPIAAKKAKEDLLKNRKISGK